MTDNSLEVKGAFQILMEWLGIPQVRISPYNSKANGVVEQGHFTIWEALVKACQGNLRSWPEKVPLAFWADRVTVSKTTGFSPYYLLHGTHPVLPFDLTEVTFLVHPFKESMSTEDLLAARIRQLEKRPKDFKRAAQRLRKSRLYSKEQFEKRYHSRMQTKELKPGQMVIVRNMKIEQSLEHKKVEPRYLGPYKIVRRTPGGSYVIEELDGAVS